MNKKDQTKKKQPLRGKRLKKTITGAQPAKKTKETQQVRSPTVKQSLVASNVINITEEQCSPYSLEEVTALINLVAPPNITGIGRQPIFRTNEFYNEAGGSLPMYKPVDVMKALMAFMNSDISLTKACKLYSINEHTFRASYLRDYPEVRTMFELSRTRKPEAFINKAQEVMMGKIPDRFYEETKTGERLSGAGIQHINNKTNFNVKMAQMAERRAFNEKIELKVDFEVVARAKDVDLAEFANVPLKYLSSML